MALPTSVRKLGSFKGEKGRPGTFDSATAATVAADQPASATISGADGEVVHFDIPRGLPGTNAVANDEAFATYIRAGDSDTRDALTGFTQDSLQVFNARDYGAKGDGVTSDSAAIAAAIAAATDSSTVVIPPGRYLLTEPIQNAGKSVAFECSGAVFLKGGAFTTLNLTGAFNTFRAVSSVEPVVITEADESTPGLRLTLAAAPDWRQGDIVKVVSDDVIPGSKDEGSGATQQGRLGQFFVVHSVDSEYVDVKGTALDTFSTNIRAGRMADVSVSWNGGVFDVTDAHISAGMRNRTINLTALPNPRLSNIAVARSTSMALGVISCYNPTVDNLNVRWCLNDHTAGGLGYAIANFSSEGLKVNGLHAQSVRSGYTDGHAFLEAGSIDWAGYGRPNNTRISDSSVASCNTGFGAHTSGSNLLIDNCIVKDCMYGIGFRGRGNRATNVTVVNASVSAVRIFTENNGRTYGHTIDGLFVDGAVNAVEFFMNVTTTSPTYNQREVRPSVVRNVHARGITGHGVRLLNASAIIDDIYVEYAAGKTGSGNYITNSSAVGGNWVFDYNQVTSTGNLALVQFPASDPSRFQVSDITGRGAKATFTKMLHGASTHIIRANFVLDATPSSMIHDPLNAASWVAWMAVEANESSSASIVFNSTQLADAASLAQIAWRRDPVLCARVALSSATTIAALPAPSRLGQVLIIQNNGSAALTVQHGSAFATNLVGGANVSVPAGQSIMFLGAAGVWQHIKPV